MFKSKIESWKRRFTIRQRPLLNLHPYIWLGERFADKRLMAAVTTLVVLMITVVSLYLENQRIEYGLVVPFSHVASFLLLVWMIAEPVSRLNEDRRAGALELVLTTPLQGPEIVRGIQRSMQRIFLGACALLAVAAFTMSHLVLMPNEDWWVVWAPLLYLAACFGALRWVGPWIGISSKSVTTGMLRSLVMIGLPAIVWIAVMILFDVFRIGRNFPSTSSENREMPWLVLGLTLLVWTAVFLRCRRIYSGPSRTFLRTATAFGGLGALIIVALALSFLLLWLWGDHRTHVFAKGFLLFHAVGMAILAYGWAKPQLQLRFRDLATRPFDN